MDVNALKESYYEYIATIPQGLQYIVNLLTNNEFEQAFNSLADLAEGLDFLVKVEEAFHAQGIISNSRLNEGITTFSEINDSLVNEDYLLLKDLLEYELIPLFSSASEWNFVDKGE